MYIRVNANRQQALVEADASPNRVILERSEESCNCRGGVFPNNSHRNITTTRINPDVILNEVKDLGDQVRLLTKRNKIPPHCHFAPTLSARSTNVEKSRRSRTVGEYWLCCNAGLYGCLFIVTRRYNRDFSVPLRFSRNDTAPHGRRA
jgi:hypothetical protein